MKALQPPVADTDADPTLLIGQHRPVNYQGSGDTVPTLRADEGDLNRAVSQAWSVVMASNRTPWVYRFAGQPTWVVPDDEGRQVATTLNEERLRHMLARLARWVRQTAKGELLPAPPPVAVVKSLLATPDPALPVLVGIVNTPVFGRSGTLITTPGYHPDARLLYAPTPGFTMPDIPTRPSAEDITAARRLLCEDLLGDFPFTGEAERAHVVALLLLGFLRGMIDGPTPLHLIEKPNPEFSNEMARRLVRIRLDANVERPWQRADFRHPDLMVWVRANRARIVAACLTLCQAWIAAGKPRGTKTIGSYENWAQIVGGVLETAGIPGFLGNLEEMMEASDSEGAGWNGFIANWWDRFGTAEVGASDVFDLALGAEPKLQVGRPGQSFDVAELGRGITKMRDRVFDVDGRKLQLTFSRSLRRSQRWVLMITEDRARQSPSAGCEVCEERCEDKNVAPHRSKSLDTRQKTERCEVCEVNPRTLTHAGTRAHAHVQDMPENTSHSSHTSHPQMKSEAYGCEEGCEADNPSSHGSGPIPDWLREVLE